MSGIRTDILIIGSGIAGLSAAIPLASRYQVAVVTKGELFNCNTDIAQGGIAAAMKEEDSPFAHFQDTMSAGDYLCREEAVKYLVEEGPVCVQELMEWGADFDRENGRLAFTREGAHRIDRVLHAHGDATGHEIQKTLVRRATSQERIRFFESTAAIDFINGSSICLGAVLFDAATGKPFPVWAGATILASGGAGQLYHRTTNTETATGDGFAMAYRLGATLEDMEFVQFHPTAFSRAEAPNFLLSEAMRGEGGLLKNSRMERFMEGYHPMAELAPRDVVSRAIWREMELTGSSHVFLDMTHFKKYFLERRFPSLFQKCLTYGVNISRDPIPVAPAAHYIMGGVKTGLDGQTSIRGLFACGEAACVGVHGANRLASNSLLEGLVFGKRAGLHLLANPEFLISSSAGSGQPMPVTASLGEAGPDDAANLAMLRERFRRLMWNGIGIIRTAESLQMALAGFDEIQQLLVGYRSIRSHELQEMLITGRCIATAALTRKGSLGGHFRKDYPGRGDTGKLHVDLVQRDREALPQVRWTE